MCNGLISSLAFCGFTHFFGYSETLKASETDNLIFRFRGTNLMRSVIEELVRSNPSIVCHLPDALPLFLADSNVFETSDVRLFFSISE